MMQNVPEDLRYLPEAAMKIWFENEDRTLPENDLETLREIPDSGNKRIIIRAKKGLSH